MMANKKYYIDKFKPYMIESHTWKDIKEHINNILPVEEATEILTNIEYDNSYKRSKYAPAYNKYYFLYYNKKLKRLCVALDKSKNILM